MKKIFKIKKLEKNSRILDQEEEKKAYKSFDDDNPYKAFQA